MKIDLNYYDSMELYKDDELLLSINTKASPNIQLVLNHKNEQDFEYTSSSNFDSELTLGSEILHYLTVDRDTQSRCNVESLINKINNLLRRYDYTLYCQNEKFTNVIVSDIYKFVTNDAKEIHIQFVKQDRLNDYKKIIFDVDLEVLRFYTYPWDSNLYVDAIDVEDELDRIAEDKLYQDCLEKDSGNQMLYEKFYETIPTPTDKDFYNTPFDNQPYIPTKLEWHEYKELFYSEE